MWQTAKDIADSVDIWATMERLVREHYKFQYRIILDAKGYKQNLADAPLSMKSIHLTKAELN